MHFFRLVLFFIISVQLIIGQSPNITPRVVPAPGEIYTYKFIKQTTAIDTSLVGENIFWDFSKAKDTATYYEEVYRESLPSQNEIFEDSYSVDSNSTRTDVTIWVNYLDSTKYYRLGAFEKDHIFNGHIPYIYDDTLMLMKFPFAYKDQMNDKYAFIKEGRRHHKNQYIDATVRYDAYGTLILPNNDTCHQAMRVRREERIFNMVNGAPQSAGVKVYFYWYSAQKQNYFLKAIYLNGKPYEAWYQKKRALIKKKRN